MIDVRLFTSGIINVREEKSPELFLKLLGNDNLYHTKICKLFHLPKTTKAYGVGSQKRIQYMNGSKWKE